ncbi:MAG: HAD-IA family hydrolase [Acidiferrobacterales bacterium]|nr:HAD-IA family hydrolase [Acidiferrobacterales bacterium]
MYKLLIFDWDGTLMDSAQKIANCIKAAARDLSLEEPSDSEAKNIIGLGLDQAMRILFPKLEQRQLSDLVEAYKYHFVIGDETAQGLFEGVAEGLHQLHESGVFLAVATGKSRQGLDRVFGETELKRYFVATRCADETRSKPHPQMLLELLEYTAIDSKNSIMIGDTTYDMDMAKNANMHGLGVSYGVHAGQDLLKSQAVDVVDSFNSVVSWLSNGRLQPAY